MTLKDILNDAEFWKLVDELDNLQGFCQYDPYIH